MSSVKIVLMTNDLNRIKCEWEDCRQFSESHYDCYIHLKTHTAQSKQTCHWNDCEYKGSSLTNLNHHIKRHLNMIEGICTICPGGTRFKYKHDLSKHLQKFHPRNMKIERTKTKYFGGFVFVPIQKEPHFLKLILN